MNPDLKAIREALEHLTAVLQKGWWDYANTILVGLTLIVLMLYTIETFRLRLAAQRQTEETGKLLTEAQKQNEVASKLHETAQQQTCVTSRHLAEAQRQNEIAVMPMLAVYVDSSMGQSQKRIALKNVGLGPAFNLSIENPHWDQKSIEIEHGGNVMTPGEVQLLTFHLQEGNHATKLTVDSLYFSINTEAMPDPLEIIVRCVSLHLTPYEFFFKCTPAAGRLKITFDRSQVKGLTSVLPPP